MTYSVRPEGDPHREEANETQPYQGMTCRTEIAVLANQLDAVQALLSGSEKHLSRGGDQAEEAAQSANEAYEQSEAAAAEAQEARGYARAAIAAIQDADKVHSALAVKIAELRDRVAWIKSQSERERGIRVEELNAHGLRDLAAECIGRLTAMVEIDL
jgi:flagellar biosynthesis/type III secretory pathway protein FliH